MTKLQFIHQIKQYLESVQSLSKEEIEINSSYFSKRKGAVSFFLSEIERTAETLINQHEITYIEYYSDQLIKQFDALNKAVSKIHHKKKTVQFHSSFQFSANVHHLSPTKRLQEYRKALRALNEKISWLMEQNYNEEDEMMSQALQNQITETEYRKSKCLKAIEDLEQELQFR